MRLKLDDDSKDAKAIFSERFTKKTIHKMVTDYRVEIGESENLKYSHFSLEEILQLCIDNGVLDENKDIKDQLGAAKTKGLKLYLGKHANDNKPPYDKYNGFTTIIICNTNVVSKTDYKFQDLLTDKKHSVSIGLARLGNAGEGLDMTNICPPECIKDGVYDIGECTTC